MATYYSLLFIAVCVLAYGWTVKAWPLSIDATLFARENNQTPSYNDPASNYFTRQFQNPSGVMSVLLLLGGDIVQKAVAQLTGGRHDVLTPAVFSFGWVAYAVGSIATAAGDGSFLPKPDYPGYVVTVRNPKNKVGSGDHRENQSWILGRLLRDLELAVERGKGNDLLKSGLMVTVYKIDPCEGKSYKPLKPKRDWIWWSAVWGITAQLGIASGPWALKGNWSIFLILLVGNTLATLTACLPSMRMGRSGFRKKSTNWYALTRGNGHKHVFIIVPDTNETDVHEDEVTNLSSLPHLDEMAICTYRANTSTRILLGVLAFFWVMLLIATGGLTDDTWWLLGAGFLGTILNILVSSLPRTPEAHGMPLEKPINKFGYRGSRAGAKPKVREVLLQLERVYPGVGHALKPLFFTGLPSDVDQEWNGDDVSWESAQRRLNEVRREQQPQNLTPPTT